MRDENKPASDQNIADPFQWPPPDFVDDFTPPKFYVAKFTNHFGGMICTLNDGTPPPPQPTAAPPAAPAEAPPQRVGYHSEKKLAVFFCHLTTLAVPTQANVVMQDWMLHKIEENRGVATNLLIHRSTAEAIALLRHQRGNVTMKMHAVPHPVEHGVFTISEIYVLHPSYEDTLFDDALQAQCHYCQRQAACGACKCERVHFCSYLCRERAVQSGLHTEDECTAALAQRLLASMTDARRILNEHSEQMRAEKRAESMSTDLALEERSKAQVVANIAPKEAPAAAASATEKAQ